MPQSKTKTEIELFYTHAQFSLCKKLNLLNSLCFPCLEKLTAKFPVFLCRGHPDVALRIQEYILRKWTKVFFTNEHELRTMRFVGRVSLVLM